MTPEDRDHARIALERGWLTIDQVAACKEAMEKTGMGFLEVARAKGLAVPAHRAEPAAPRKGVPLPYVVLLMAAVFVLLGWEVFSGFRAAAQQRRLEENASEFRRRADDDARRHSEEVTALLEQRRREEAEKNLTQGRALFLRAEELSRQDPAAEPTLKEATRFYSLYLAVYPEDPAILLERSRVHELRGAFVDALADLRRVSALDPSRAEAVAAKIRELEFNVTR